MYTLFKRLTLFLGAALFVVTMSCGLSANYVNTCDKPPCTSCTSDKDCFSFHSCCGNTFFCHNKKDEPRAVCAMGCTKPSPIKSCGCKQGRCQF